MSQDPHALLQKADKAASGAGGGFSFFGGRAEKWEGAADLYIQAANAFRMQKMNKEAGQAFEKAASIQINQLKEPDDAANNNVEAYKVYKKNEPEDAARCLDAAVNHYTSKGNFRRAASNKEKLAEIYEQDLHNPKKALESYELAANWYESDNAEALANKLYLKVADISGLEADYYRAVENFEKVASSNIGSNLMRWSLKDYFLRSGICLLAIGDIVAINKALEKYREMDNSFAETREHQLLVDLSEAVAAGDKDVFADQLFQYDRINKLDKWKTTILLRVKNAIEEQGEDFS